jgi:hypothetical protein
MRFPSRSIDLKKVNASDCCPFPRMLNPKDPDSLMRAWMPESALTPTTRSGGSKDVWVAQLTVEAAARPSFVSAVST